MGRPLVKTTPYGRQHAHRNRHRELIALRDRYGLTNEDIALLTECQVNTVLSWTCDPATRRASMIPGTAWELLKIRIRLRYLEKIKRGMSGAEEERLIEEARREIEPE